MPRYVFKCKKCGERFEQTLTVEQMEKGEAECPKCHAKEAELDVSEFFCITSKKS